jgi:hypothetical protein
MSSTRNEFSHPGRNPDHEPVNTTVFGKIFENSLRIGCQYGPLVKLGMNQAMRISDLG